MKRFVIADLHLGHVSILGFEPARTHFTDIDHMHQTLIVRWNTVVGDKDTVYVLGDVAFRKDVLPLLGRMKGRKILIKGNHDLYSLDKYTPYFEDIRACHVIGRTILTHIPVHPGQSSRYSLNIHGHLHSQSLNDPFYKCVSCEQVNFTPLELENDSNRHG